MDTIRSRDVRHDFTSDPRILFPIIKMWLLHVCLTLDTI